MAYLLNKIKVASNLFLFDIRMPLRKNRSFICAKNLYFFLRLRLLPRELGLTYQPKRSVSCSQKSLRVRD